MTVFRRYMYCIMRQMLPLMLLMCGCAVARGADIAVKYKGNTLYFNVVAEDSVELTYSDKSRNNYPGLVNLHLPFTIEYDKHVYIVRGIGEEAMAWCSTLHTVYFNEHSNIRYIGKGAFAGCASLTQFEIPEAVTRIEDFTFAWSGLQYINIHDNITSIGNRAFSNCSYMDSLYMSKNVTSIGDFAFTKCTRLLFFRFPEQLKKLGFDVLMNSDNIKDVYYDAIDCSSAGTYYDKKNRCIRTALSDLKQLSFVHFGKKVKNIPAYLLYNCKSIDRIELPSTVEVINEYAFEETQWLKDQPEGIVYINHTAYAYKGVRSGVKNIVIKEGTRYISPYCFMGFKDAVRIDFCAEERVIGKNAFTGCWTLPNVDLPTDLDSIGPFAFSGCGALEDIKFNRNIRAIDAYCFSKCGSLVEVSIPNTVTYLGEGVFYKCDGLYKLDLPDELVKIPDGVCAKCPNLVELKLPVKSDSLGVYAFDGCVRLESISLPDGVEYVGERAFNGCSSLTDLDLGSRRKYVGDYAFSGCTSLYNIDLESVWYLGNRVFNGCHELRRIWFGDEIEHIGNWACYRLENVSEINLSQAISYIGKSAFEGCTFLHKLSIMGDSTVIDNQAFAGCSSLENLTLSPGVRVIGEKAFWSCRSLPTVSLPDSAYSIFADAFAKCSALESVTTGSGTRNIGTGAFAECGNLRKVNLNSRLEVISDYAFKECYALDSLVMPDELRHIGYQAFYGTALTGVTIPLKVEYIGTGAFGDCRWLSSVDYKARYCTFAGSSLGVFRNTADTLSVNIDPLVEVLPENLFAYTNVRSVSLPNSITDIQRHVFYRCRELESVEINPYGGLVIDNEAFAESKWESANRADGVTYMNDIAMYVDGTVGDTLTVREGTTIIAANFATGNKNVKTLVLPNTVQVIGRDAFYDCTGLREVTLPESLNTVMDGAFQNCAIEGTLTFPKTMVSVGASAFANCDSLDKVVISDAKMSIGFGAFAGSEYIDTVLCGSKLTRMDDGAFAYCSSLKYFAPKAPERRQRETFILPGSIDTLHYSVFSNCGFEGVIELPNSVKTVEGRAFAGCSKIDEIVIGVNVSDFDVSALIDMDYLLRIRCGELNEVYAADASGLYDKQKTAMLRCPSGRGGEVTVGGGVKTVGRRAFENCQFISEITGMKNVEKVDDYAFRGCKNMVKISFGEKLAELGRDVFEDCERLTDIVVHKDNAKYRSEDGILYSADMTELIMCPPGRTGEVRIPASVTKIADYAFANCTKLTSVLIPRSVTYTGENAFYGTTCRRMKI